MTCEILQKRLASNLKRERKLKNFTQEKLTESAELSAQMINDIEGCRRWPSEKSLVRIVNALNIDVQNLFILNDETEIISKSAKMKVSNDIKEMFNSMIDKYISK